MPLSACAVRRQGAGFGARLFSGSGSRRPPLLSLLARMCCLLRTLLHTPTTWAGGLLDSYWVCLGDGSTPRANVYAGMRVYLCLSRDTTRHITLWSYPLFTFAALLLLFCRARVPLEVSALVGEWRALELAEAAPVTHSQCTTLQ